MVNDVTLINANLKVAPDAITLAREQLKSDEGLRLKAYTDTEGHLTIGYGRNLENGISHAAAELMLSEDIVIACDDCLKVFGDDFLSYSPRRQAALINMLFNLGLKRFQKFQQTIAFIKQGRWEKAAAAALESKWATQVKGRAVRVAEALRNG